MELRIRTIKTISCNDLDNFVKSKYGHDYCFQQQDGCRERGNYIYEVSSDMEDDILEDVEEGECIPLYDWKNLTKDEIIDKYNRESFFFYREYYPSVYAIFADMLEDNEIDEGEYTIIVDW